MCLGVRKTEFCEAKWEEFELDKALWYLPSSRSKTGVGFTIPLAPEVMVWLDESIVRGFGSIFANQS